MAPWKYNHSRLGRHQWFPHAGKMKVLLSLTQHLFLITQKSHTPWSHWQLVFLEWTKLYLKRDVSVLFCVFDNFLQLIHVCREVKLNNFQCDVYRQTQIKTSKISFVNRIFCSRFSFAAIVSVLGLVTFASLSGHCPYLLHWLVADSLPYLRG